MTSNSILTRILSAVLELDKKASVTLQSTSNSLSHGCAKLLDHVDALNSEIRKGLSQIGTTVKRSTKKILDQGMQIESINREGFRQLAQALEQDREAVRLISDGLRAHRERHFENTPIPALSNDLLRLFWTDKSIKWPHRRILDFLAQQWCFTKHEFKEVHQNEIVKQANISRSMIKQHLTHLLDRGLIERREGHGRIFYRINGELGTGSLRERDGASSPSTSSYAYLW